MAIKQDAQQEANGQVNTDARMSQDTARMQYISGANDKDSPKDYITGSNRSVWKRRTARQARGWHQDVQDIAQMQCEGVFGYIPVQGIDKNGSFGVGMDALLWTKSDWGVTICYALVFYS